MTDTINNLHDLADWLGAARLDEFNHRIYKDTACGASISLYFDWREPLHCGRAAGWKTLTLDAPGVIGFTIQTIVEGSHADVNSDLFRFPVPVAEVDKFVEYMEAESDALWHEANDDEEDAGETRYEEPREERATDCGYARWVGQGYGAGL